MKYRVVLDIGIGYTKRCFDFENIEAAAIFAATALATYVRQKDDEGELSVCIELKQKKEDE